MKVTSYSFAASAVAFSATVLALPALYKRAGDAKKVFECFATYVPSLIEIPGAFIFMVANRMHSNGRLPLYQQRDWEW